jgi:hypothetical protein
MNRKQLWVIHSRISQARLSTRLQSAIKWVGPLRPGFPRRDGGRGNPNGAA